MIQVDEGSAASRLKSNKWQCRWGSYQSFTALTFVALSVEWVSALHLVRSQGGSIGGDEPWYLAEAVSIGRFHTLNLNPAFNFAIEHRIIFPWRATPGPHVAAQIGAIGFSHGLYFPFHAIGLSVLLSIPMLFGTNVAVISLIILSAAATTLLCHVTGSVSRSSSPWRIFIAGLFLAPPIALAATQVYPDLLTGLVIALIVMSIALLETLRKINRGHLILVAVLLVVLPWLDQKNIFFPLPLLVAFLVASLRATVPRNGLRLVVVPTLLSLCALLSLNLYAFGHLLGGGQQIQLAGMETSTRFIALLFDRRQGLLIQMPVCLLGIAGLWVTRKRIPVAVLTAVGATLAILYGNATQPISFGGGSFVGRFQWPALPIMLAFAGLFLIQLWRVRSSATVLGVLFVIFTSYALQAVPILKDEHAYLNHFGWDPITYTGWWGGLDPSPVLGYIGGVTVPSVLRQFTFGGPLGFVGATSPWGNARIEWGLACVVLVCATLTYCLVYLLRSYRMRLVVIGGALGGIALTLAMTLSSPALLPPPAVFGATSMLISHGKLSGTSVVATGSAERGLMIQGPYWQVLPGQYEAIIKYRLNDPEPAAAVLIVQLITKPPEGGIVQLNSVDLPEAQTSLAVPFLVSSAGQLVLSVYWHGSGIFVVSSITLAKSSSKPTVRATGIESLSFGFEHEPVAHRN